MTKRAVRGTMTSKNTCWECSNNTLKLKILVPHNCTIREYVRTTGNLCSDIVAVVKEKQGKYTIWLRYGNDLKLVSIRMVHECTLKIETGKKDIVCKCFKQKGEQILISNIIYSRTPVPGIAILVPKLNSTCAVPKMVEQIASPA
jgi:hypothetical protein